MDKQKQMEELTKDLYRIQTYAIMDVYPCAQKQPNELVAEHLVRWGYRKIPEGAVVLTRAELEEIKRIKEMTNEQEVESEKLKNSIAEAVNSFVRLETLYKIKCKELEIAEEKTRKETAEKIYQMADELATGSQNDGVNILCAIKKEFGL